jgi:hypothetical protein
LRSGADHPRAKLTDQEVDQMRNMADAGWSYAQLAEAFEMSKGGVAKIVKCIRRAVVPVLAD